MEDQFTQQCYTDHNVLCILVPRYFQWASTDCAIQRIRSMYTLLSGSRKSILTTPVPLPKAPRSEDGSAIS